MYIGRQGEDRGAPKRRNFLKTKGGNLQISNIRLLLILRISFAMDQLWQRFEAISNNNLKSSCKERIENCEKYEEDAQKCCSEEGKDACQKKCSQSPIKKNIEAPSRYLSSRGGGDRAFT